MNDSTPQQPLAYSPARVAELLDVSHSHVLNMIKSGQLRAARIGRRWIVPVDAITTLLQSA